MKHENWCLTFCCNRCILTKGVNGQKPPGQNLSDKRHPDKTPGQKLPRTIEREFVQGAFVWVFCTRPTKNRGGQRCVTYFRGGPEMCDKVCQRGGRGSKLAKNSVTYFMDSPIATNI